MFRKRRGIRLPYNKQGLIHFICINVKDMPEDIQQKILNMCIEIGGEDYKALYEVLTNDFKTVTCISRETFVSEKRLYALRKRFYENWFK